MIELHCGDCLDILPTLPDASVDAVISDPPYPMILRQYGRMSEAAWTEMMHAVVRETRRVLKPTGSAVFVLQPNWRKVGSMRPWLYEFLSWCCREWNVIQDIYWWNTTALPKCGQVRSRALPRPSVKPCVWIVPPDCYRDIDSVLAPMSETTRTADPAGRGEISRPPSGWRGTTKPKFHRRTRMYAAARARGGVTPFNVLPISNGDSSGRNSAGASGHPAGTPFRLCDWWVRFISPAGGVVLDPFVGSGTVGLAALAHGRSIVGIERDPEYFAIARRRLEAAAAPAVAV